MSEKEKEELMKDIYKLLGNNLLSVPVLDGYEIVETDNDSIFVAKSHNYSTEQFLCDGVLKENETLDQRIEKVIKKTEEEMKKNNLKNPQIDFLNTFNTNLFNFRLYLQDMIKDKKIIRQVNAFFIEPRNNYFYEICLSSPPMPLDIANEDVLKNLITGLTIVLQNIKYNDNPLNVKND